MKKVIKKWNKLPKSVKVFFYMVLSTILAEGLIELGSLEQSFVIRILAQVINLAIVLIEDVEPIIKAKLKKQKAEQYIKIRIEKEKKMTKEELVNKIFRLYRLKNEGKNVQVQLVMAEDELRNICILETMNVTKSKEGGTRKI